MEMFGVVRTGAKRVKVEVAGEDEDEELQWSAQAIINSEKRFPTLRIPQANYNSCIKIKWNLRERHVTKKMRWYYEKKELRGSPSVQAGMELDTEARYRREGARFIIDIGSSMNLSLTTMATGVVYFHRFYMVHTLQDFPRYPTALGCLFLAGKVEETPKKCKDMLKVARDILTDEKWATFGPDVPTKCQEEIMTLERIILQTIKFDLHVEHPYTFLLKYAKCLKGDKARLQKMVQMAWTFVNDSLCTTLCLQWEPEIVAIALMHLAGKLSKFEVQDWIGRTSDHYRWWDMFVEGMTIELLEDICHQVLDLYSQTQAAVSANSPPPPNQSANTNNRNPPLPPQQNNSQPGSGGSSKSSTPVSGVPPPFPPPGAQLPPQPYGAYPPMPPHHMLPHPPPFSTAPPPPVPGGFMPPVRGGQMPPMPVGSYPPPPIPHQQYLPQPPLPPRANQPPPPPK